MRRDARAWLLLPLLALAGLSVLLLDSPEARPAARQASQRAPGLAEPSVAAAVVTSACFDPAPEKRARSDPPAAIDSSRVLVRGVALLDDDPMRGARLRFVSAPGAREVVTDEEGAFALELEPGTWVVWPPFAADEQIVGRALEYDDLGALRLALRDRSTRGQPRTRPWLQVLDDRSEPAASSPHPRVRPGGAVLLRFDSPWVIEGRVVDADTGAPVATTRIRVQSAAGVRERRVDAEGAFHLRVARDDLEGSFGRLKFSAPGYAPTATHLAARLDDAAVRRPMLVRLRRALTLTGRVRDLEGRPLRAEVVVKGELPDTRTGEHVSGGRWTTTCDDEGRFTIDAIPPGAGDAAPAGPHAASVSVTVTHPGFMGGFLHPVHVHEGAPPLELRLTAPGSLVGRVVDEGGRPVAGATVEGQGTDEPIDTGDGLLVTRGADVGRTQADGRFVLTQVPERALVLVKARGYPRTWFEVWLPVPDLELRLSAPAPPIEGRALTPDGEPYVDTMIVAFAHGRSLKLELERPGTVRRFEEWFVAAEVDADGRFRLDRLPNRPAFDLGAAAYGRRAFLTGVAPGARDVELVIGPRLGNVRAEVPAEGIRAGTWLRLHDPTGELVSHREVTTYGGDGHVVLGLHEPGRHTLVVTAPGFRPLLLPVEAAGRDVDLGLLRLAPGGGRLELHVTWPPGPAPALRARLRDATSGLGWVHHLRPPSALGVPLVVDPLPPGSITIELTARAHDGTERALRPLDVTLRDGETTRVDLDLR